MGRAHPCYGCTDRRIGCHGQDEKGRWLCERWGDRQEGKERVERLKRADQDIDNYRGDVRRARERRRKSHHTV